MRKKDASHDRYVRSFTLAPKKQTVLIVLELIARCVLFLFALIVIIALLFAFFVTGFESLGPEN